MSRARTIYSLGFLACAVLLAYALYLQHVEHLDPCPLCIFQRIVFILIAAVCLVAVIHNPSGWGRRVYAGGVLVLSIGGAALAARHVWLQHFPQTAECGAGLDYMIAQFPINKVFSLVLKGTGECGDILWSFLGLSIPAWTLIVFVIFLTVSLWCLLRPPQP
ncbi:MAG: disulfide bond formation protein B [Gammaproteobacteria bacterium]|nr:disulfide bond formation protein B [Gammaproteobacteria bacterium]